MKAFIPEIGSHLELEKDWTFTVYHEHRNRHLVEADGYKLQDRYPDDETYERTLPKGSKFKIDRIYVRQGASGWSSVTLLLFETTDKTLDALKKKGEAFKSNGVGYHVRFWVKLIDFNSADFTVIKDTSQPAVTVEVCGKPITLSRFKNRTNAHWWVKFVHEDPELCFDGIMNSYKIKSVGCSQSRDHNLLKRGWTERKENYSGPSGQATYYQYSPPHYIYSLIPLTWIEEHRDNPRFKTMTKDYFGRTYEKFVHPLEDELHIPRTKKERQKLGLENDKSLMKDVKIAGGLLTVCDIAVEEG